MNLMDELKPVTKSEAGVTALSIRRASGCGLRRVVVMLAALVLAVCVARSAWAAEQKTAQSQSADSVGSETCATCHEDAVKNFSGNPHTKLALEHGKSGASCESCHGPGREHVEGGGDKTKIFNFKTATEKQVSARCLGCHAGTHPNFERSPHAKAAVGCTSCHSVHAPNKAEAAQEKLLTASAPQLCFGCHNDVKPQFSMPFHHKVNEGAVNCDDCHEVHGTFGNSNLRSTADQNAICTRCHTEKRGPFVYEHAAVKGEGCLSCHTPHGSQNARLLNVASVNVLCSQCHSAVATSTIHNFTWTQSGDVTPCIDCHTMVHGSNLEPGLIR